MSVIIEYRWIKGNEPKQRLTVWVMHVTIILILTGRGIAYRYTDRAVKAVIAARS